MNKPIDLYEILEPFLIRYKACSTVIMILGKVNLSDSSMTFAELSSVPALNDLKHAVHITGPTLRMIILDLHTLSSKLDIRAGICHPNLDKVPVLH